MDTQTILTIITIGLAAGMLSGMLGVGGGIILVPAMVFFLGYTQHQAQGASLALLTLPVTILAFLKYYQETKTLGMPMDFKVIGLLAAGFVVGGFVGGAIAMKINADLLKKIFAIILFYAAFKMLNWDTMFIKWLKSVF